MHTNPYADWSANLFTAKRIQYIILTNTTSLYSILTLGRGITNEYEFAGRLKTVLEEQLRAAGFAFVWDRLISPEFSSGFRFSKSYSRSVTGSMNDMIHCAKFMLVEGESSPFDVSNELNWMPMSMIEHVFPDDEFRSQTLE